MTKPKQITKTKLAQKLGVSRSSLYYKPKLPDRDGEVKHQIEAVLTENPEYGHKFGIKPRRRKVKRPKKPGDVGNKPSSFSNVSLLWCPIREGVLWASDFTYLYFQGRFFYLATIIDVHTREIVGYHLARHHQTNLVLSALEDALSKHHSPLWIHSDQGSEYNSKMYINRCRLAGINISMSAKASPWHNPFQESFYDKFKVTLGFLDRFENLGELIAAIHEAVYYYNHKRIHSALKMSPIAYKQLLTTNNDRLTV
jgi:putative transposase